MPSFTISNDMIGAKLKRITWPWPRPF